jgi:hypothetical protein
MRYTVEVTLPANLQPGQFQGLFFENVEAEFTTELAPPTNWPTAGAALGSSLQISILADGEHRPMERRASAKIEI